MNLYAESSAILAWLLEETPGAQVHRLVSAADTVISSDLTMIECDRALHRASAIGTFDVAHATILRSRLTQTAQAWTIQHLTAPIVERARQPFPAEPIRTLDALHVASALHARRALPALALLSLDDRVRKVGGALGFRLAPD